MVTEWIMPVLAREELDPFTDILYIKSVRRGPQISVCG